MANIILMVPSPLGDYLYLNDRDTVNWEETSFGKKKKKYVVLTLAALIQRHITWMSYQVNLLSLEFHTLVQL